MKKIILFLALVLSVSTQAQVKVTQIWTDYGGFWTSSSTSPNSVEPDNSHNLLAFRVENLETGTEKIYSTGVDDAKLTTNGVSFEALTIRALPIATLPTTVEDFYLVGLGDKFDGIEQGIDTSPTSPFPAITQGSEVAFFLTNGINGLDLGTCITNIPSETTSRFNLSSGGIKASEIGGAPDIFVSQIANPAFNLIDKLRFVDDNGVLVGKQVSINLGNATNYPSVGNWQADFYRFNSVSAEYSMCLDL
jgi:hypothetical protein